MTSLVDSPEYQALAAARDELRSETLRRLFASDPERASRYSARVAGLYVDFSKHLVTDKVWDALFAYARSRNVPQDIARMFAGEKVNITERRAALHVALRAPAGASFMVDGRDVQPEIQNVRAKVTTFANALRSGLWRGATGERITDVVNIGIGGSDLGPRMVCRALRPYIDGPTPHFVANVDAEDLEHALLGLRPATTLFIVCSKTFTTEETLLNARSARGWVTNHLGAAAVGRHFVAVSTNEAETRSFGIERDSMFGFWDWVGGRYSLWSAVGLSIACAVGPTRFDELLAGASAVDAHVRDSKLEGNVAARLALLGFWYANFWRGHAHAVLPYSQALEFFPRHLQQLEMESNGKGIDRSGHVIADYQTAPILFGEPGTNGQHAFYQLLHQSNRVVPSDFIIAASSDIEAPEHERVLKAHFVAQTAALAFGRTREEVDGNLHRICPGNRPSTSIVLERLDAPRLGALVALYEHKVAIQGSLFNVNSFDQYGVELGKVGAKKILAALVGGTASTAEDSSTRSLLEVLSGR